MQKDRTVSLGCLEIPHFSLRIESGLKLTGVQLISTETRFRSKPFSSFQRGPLQLPQPQSQGHAKLAEMPLHTPTLQTQASVRQYKQQSLLEACLKLILVAMKWKSIPTLSVVNKGDLVSLLHKLYYWRVRRTWRRQQEVKYQGDGSYIKTP